MPARWNQVTGTSDSKLFAQVVTCPEDEVFRCTCDSLRPAKGLLRQRDRSSYRCTNRKWFLWRKT